ncbi:MAG: hypothetical protein Kow0090_06980 [Myxococcota bacterium]
MGANSFADSFLSQEIVERNSFNYTEIIRFLLSFFFVLLMVVSTLFYVHNRIMVLNLGYKIAIASREFEELKQENKRLAMEFSALTNPERIEKIARERLKMTNLHHSRIIKVKIQN